MSAEDILDRINEVQRAYLADPRRHPNYIVLTAGEIQAYMSEYTPGATDLHQVGVVRIVQKGAAMAAAPPAKYVDPSSDLARYRMEVQLAIKADRAPREPDEYEQRLIDAEKAGMPLPQREPRDTGRAPSEFRAEDPLGPSPFEAAIKQAKAEILSEVGVVLREALAPLMGGSNGNGLAEPDIQRPRRGRRAKKKAAARPRAAGRGPRAPSVSGKRPRGRSD